MAKACKCDRCGYFYEPINKPSKFTIYGSSVKPLDLCDVCEDRLKKFLNNEPVGAIYHD